MNNNDIIILRDIFNNSGVQYKNDVLVYVKAKELSPLVITNARGNKTKYLLNDPNKEYKVYAPNTGIQYTKFGGSPLWTNIRDLNTVIHNGKITIKFYKERQYEQHYTITTTPWYNVNYNTYTGDTIKEYSSALTTGIDANSYSNVNSSIQCLNASLDLDCNSIGAGTSATTYTSYGATIQTNACIDKSISTNDSISTYNTSKPLQKVKSRSMETGRIESGSHSNQKFNTVYNNFETFPFKTETILILPTSRKPVTPNDLEKKYCYNCGRKLNKKFTYCPFCGAKQ
jgi:hypothetical protein